MATTTYKSDSLESRRVKYTGSDSLKKGYLVCWNRDSTTKIDPKGSETYDATASNFNRHREVEKPAAGNLYNFAGVVANAYSAVSGGQEIEILIPRNNAVQVYTSLNCTSGTTLLCIQPGSYVAGATGTGPVIGRAVQTVDRSSTNGTVQAVCDMPSPIITPYHTAAGRLCSPAIWEKCPTDLIRFGVIDGYDYFQDFISGKWAQAANVAAAASTLSDGCAFTGATAGATLASAADAPYGVVKLSNTTDGETTILQLLGGVNAGGQVVFESGKKVFFETRVKVANITTNQHGMFCGFAQEGRAIDAGIISAADALADVDLVGFHYTAVATTAFGTYHNTASGGGVTTIDSTAGTLAADTWTKLGIYCDGTTVYFYQDGVLLDTSVLLSATNFPSGEEMAMYLALVVGSGGGDCIVSVDWVRIAMIR